MSGDVEANLEQIAQTFRLACQIANEYGEVLVFEGEICWGGMHGWRWCKRLKEAVDRRNLLFQADEAHTLLFMGGYNCGAEDSLLPAGVELTSSTPQQRRQGWVKITNELGPFVGSFHVAQNDGTVKKPTKSGEHGYTGKHCLIDDPNGLVDVAEAACLWLLEDVE
jgi:hypothetical protein